MCSFPWPLFSVLPFFLRTSLDFRGILLVSLLLSNCSSSVSAVELFYFFLPFLKITGLKSPSLTLFHSCSRRYPSDLWQILFIPLALAIISLKMSLKSLTPDFTFSWSFRCSIDWWNLHLDVPQISQIKHVLNSETCLQVYECLFPSLQVWTPGGQNLGSLAVFIDESQASITMRRGLFPA